MLGSIIGSFMVRSGESSKIKDLSHALHMGTNVAMAIAVVGVFIGGYMVFDGDARWGIPLSVIFGLAAGWAIGKVAEIWTSDEYGPVKKIAEQTQTGPATVILKGISSGMISVGASVTLIAAAIAGSYWAGQQALWRQPTGWHLRHRDRRYRHARHHRRSRWCRRLRTNRRQRRRYRRNG